MTDLPRLLRPSLRGGLEESKPLTFPKPKRKRLNAPPSAEQIAWCYGQLSDKQKKELTK
jgi:hypothetical protein